MNPTTRGLLTLIGLTAVSAGMLGTQGDRMPVPHPSKPLKPTFEPDLAFKPGKVTLAVKREGWWVRFSVANGTEERIAIGNYPGYCDAFFWDTDRHHRYLSLNIDAADMRPMSVEEVVLLPKRSAITFFVRIDEYQAKRVPLNAKIWGELRPFGSTLYDAAKSSHAQHMWLKPFILKEKVVSPEVPY